MTQNKKRKKMHRIFLSYAMDDRAAAERLHDLISKYPAVNIFTTQTLSAGENWQAKLRDEISKCSVFLVLLSPNSVDSNWVLYELGAAWAMGKPIISIVTDPELLSKIPMELSSNSFVEIKDIEKPEDINRIFERYEEFAATE